MWNFKNSRKQGDYGLAKAIAYFARKQYTICLPLTDNQDYDLVVGDEDGNLLKVSIKTSTQKTDSDAYIANLRTMTHNHSKSNVLKYNLDNDYDMLFVVTEDERQFLFMRKDVEHLKNAITLGEQYKKFEV